MTTKQGAERLERVPGDGLAAVDRQVADRFDEVALAGLAWTADKVLPRDQSTPTCAALAGWVWGSRRPSLPRRRRPCRRAVRRLCGASRLSPGRGLWLLR